MNRGSRVHTGLGLSSCPDAEQRGTIGPMSELSHVPLRIVGYGRIDPSIDEDDVAAFQLILNRPPTDLERVVANDRGIELRSSLKFERDARSVELIATEVDRLQSELEAVSRNAEQIERRVQRTRERAKAVLDGINFEE